MPEVAACFRERPIYHLGQSTEVGEIGRRSGSSLISVSARVGEVGRNPDSFKTLSMGMDGAKTLGGEVEYRSHAARISLGRREKSSASEPILWMDQSCFFSGEKR